MQLCSHVAPSGFKGSGIGVDNDSLRDDFEVSIEECGQ